MFFKLLIDVVIYFVFIQSGDGNACTPYAFFVHEDARPLPFLDKVKNMEYNH